ncbi:hypothetical protein CERZMDRAFT_88063 [Cercospora zeae-maydis SCOH1-5]|uniref:Uncharacterized protein n=1 Tax=Cercospora zeae-maydis SCOH1-5 TaxID=717836 RepID=A0A6A6F6K9_9PEZI|nr:hypothetical protein CERZMDRAFT_88063 [Cercospora zeae-maydis SCOH1-5]
MTATKGEGAKKAALGNERSTNPGPVPGTGAHQLVQRNSTCSAADLRFVRRRDHIPTYAILSEGPPRDGASNGPREILDAHTAHFRPEIRSGPGPSRRRREDQVSRPRISFVFTKVAKRIHQQGCVVDIGAIDLPHTLTEAHHQHTSRLRASRAGRVSGIKNSTQVSNGTSTALLTSLLQAFHGTNSRKAGAHELVHVPSFLTRDNEEVSSGRHVLPRAALDASFLSTTSLHTYARIPSFVEHKDAEVSQHLSATANMSEQQSKSNYAMEPRHSSLQDELISLHQVLITATDNSILRRELQRRLRDLWHANKTSTTHSSIEEIQPEFPDLLRALAPIATLVGEGEEDEEDERNGNEPCRTYRGSSEDDEELASWWPRNGAREIARTLWIHFGDAVCQKGEFSKALRELAAVRVRRGRQLGRRRWEDGRVERRAKENKSMAEGFHLTLFQALHVLHETQQGRKTGVYGDAEVERNHEWHVLDVQRAGRMVVDIAGEYECVRECLVTSSGAPPATSRGRDTWDVAEFEKGKERVPSACFDSASNAAAPQ